MELGLTKIKNELKNLKNPQSSEDKFVERMEVFYKSASREFETLKQQSELMDKRYEELSKFFCFDRKKTSMEELFGDLTSFFKDFEVNNLINLLPKILIILIIIVIIWFCVILQRARKENAKIREQIEKQKKQKEREVRLQ